MPLRTGLFVKLNRPSVGRGTSIARATTCCAAVSVMATRPKNWLCAATQTTLLAPSRYSVLGTVGIQPNFLSLKKAVVVSCVFLPSNHIMPTAVPSSYGPIGLDVPTTHSCAGNTMPLLLVFSHR